MEDSQNVGGGGKDEGLGKERGGMEGIRGVQKGCRGKNGMKGEG